MNDHLPWEGQPYSIKRHGVSITNCDSEPVQTPGCIQAHGAMLVLHPQELTILQVSENVEEILGRSITQLLGTHVAAAIGDLAAQQILAILTSEPVDKNPLYVLTLPARDSIPPLDVTLHTLDGLVVLEFEAMGHGGNEPDYYQLIKKTMIRFQTATSLQQFCEIVADEVRMLTGFDRVMVYQFHADQHGEVVAESKEEALSSLLGLHYPAGDIPKPSRDIFRKTWIRPVPDVAGGLAEITPLLNPITGKALEMTYCALRGASVMYTEYLQNMKVTAALTLSIRNEHELWGLIACHHYSGAKHIPYQVRTACEFLAQVASLQHKSAEDRENLIYRIELERLHDQLLSRAASDGGLMAMTDGSPTILDGINATGAALFHHDRWWRVGNTPNDAELDALNEWLNSRPEFDSIARPVVAIDRLSHEYPAAATFVDSASGVLAVPLSRARRNLMIWFRPETICTINWGGDPHAKPLIYGPHGPRLTPRGSFDLFVESVRGKSLPWKSIELESVLRLRLLVMELVVSRAEQLADLNADLARSNEELDAFAYVASHDLKEPLRGIHKYAYQLLEDATSAGGVEQHKLEALIRLTLRMDGLLDSLLYFSRVGRATLSYATIDMNELLAEAIEMVSSRTNHNNKEIILPRPLPNNTCDRVRVREILVNLLSNALKYNDKEIKRIEVGCILPGETHLRPNCPAGSEAKIIYFVADNGIGIREKHFEQVFKMFKRLHGRDEFGGGTGAGLSIVRKLIERLQGRIWLDSKLGLGTTFFFTLPCRDGAFDDDSRTINQLPNPRSGGLR